MSIKDAREGYIAAVTLAWDALPDRVRFDLISHAATHDLAAAASWLAAHEAVERDRPDRIIRSRRARRRLADVRAHLAANREAAQRDGSAKHGI